MWRVQGWLLGALLYCLLAVAAVAQQTCDLADSVAHPSMDIDAFFDLPRGAIALGGNCDTGSNTCASYIDISSCTQVAYPLAASGRANRLFVAINTVATCEEDCELVDSFLAAGLFFRHTDTPDAIGPFADLTRNGTSRWSAFLGSALARQSCCDGVVSPSAFAEAQGDAWQPQAFVNLTGKRWHSSFEHFIRKNVQTWAFRDFFRTALLQCGDACSVKAYLLRFQELSATEGRRPSMPLLLSANLMSFTKVRLQTMVPFGGETYKNDVLINLIR